MPKCFYHHPSSIYTKKGQMVEFFRLPRIYIKKTTKHLSLIAFVVKLFCLSEFLRSQCGVSVRYRRSVIIHAHAHHIFDYAYT